MDELFGPIDGIPLHPLVVHATVVLLPLSALVSVLVAWIRRWSPAVWPVVAGNAVVVVLAWITTQSGEVLQEALADAGVTSEAIDRHAGLGQSMPWFALGVLGASVVVALVRARPGLRWVGGVLTVLAAVAAISWTVLTGHSGAEAVWSGVGG